MGLEYNKENIKHAKQLRKNATDEEKKLWYGFLSKYEIRFQRQKAIDNFIADFFCSKANIVIELDGSQHYTKEGKEKDDIRTEILEEYGIAVIRIKNRQVRENFNNVCVYIDRIVKKKIAEKGK